MTRTKAALFCILFLLGLCLRVYDLSYPPFKWADEKVHVPAATNYWETGQFEPDNWEHPPLRHDLLYGFLRLFGDNAYGWRLRNVLAGSLSAGLLFFFAAAAGGWKAGLLAGLLLATDPLHIVLSRYTFDEVYGVAFLLAGIVVFMTRDRRSPCLMLSGFLTGCALATKWYYVPAWLLMYGLALFEHRNYRDFRSLLFISASCLLIPVTVYILSYYQWFGRGYSLAELFEFTRNAYYTLQSGLPQHYESGSFFLGSSSAADWFSRPVILGQGTYLGPERGEFIVYMNNPPVWLLTIPSILFTAALAVKRRARGAALPVLFFCASYMLYLFVRRPAFIYSAAPLLPFAFTAIAYTVTSLSEKAGPKIYYAVLAVMLGWNLFLYPFVTAKKVVLAPYRWIIGNSAIKIH